MKYQRVKTLLPYHKLLLFLIIEVSLYVFLLLWTPFLYHPPSLLLSTKHSRLSFSPPPPAPPLPLTKSDCPQAKLLLELRTHLSNVQIVKPSLIKKNRITLPLKVDANIIVVGRGPLAYILTSYLLKKQSSILLLTPDIECIISHYISGTNLSINTPESIKFYTKPIRLLSASEKELLSLAEYTNLDISTIKSAYDTLISLCLKSNSSTTADDFINELNLPDKEDISSYLFSWQTIDPIPDSNVIRTTLTSFDDQGDRLEIKLYDGQIKHCLKLIFADEFPLQLLMKNLKNVTLSCPMGISLKQKFPSAQFSRVISNHDLTISLYHDGETMTITLFIVKPSLQLSFHNSFPQYKCLISDIDPVLLPYINKLELNVDSMTPVSINPSFGILPSSSEYKLNLSKSVYVLGPLYQPSSKDPFRDSLILSLVYDHIIF